MLLNRCSCSSVTGPSRRMRGLAPVTSRIVEAVPPGLVLNPVPVEVSTKVPQLQTLSFFVKDRRVVLVDPRRNVIDGVVE